MFCRHPIIMLYIHITYTHDPNSCTFPDMG